MCLTVVVGRQATVDGSVLVGHNEENEGPYFVNFRRVHSEQFSTSELRERRSAWPPELQQPQYGFLWSQVPGREYSDNYLNEAGVVVVSNGCPSREDDLETLIDRGEIQQEGIGGLLRRIVAEQAPSAQEAVELIGRLVEKFGYRDSGRTYVVADPQEAWVVAVVRGRRWLALRTPDDAAVVVPNVFIFDRLERDAVGGCWATQLQAGAPSPPPRPGPAEPIPLRDAEPILQGESAAGPTMRCSADLVSYAIQRGWYAPGAGAPFSFREAYQSAERNQTDPRQWWGQQLLLQEHAGESSVGVLAASPKNFALVGTPLPWYVRPGRKLSVQDVAAILRNQQGPRSLFHPATQETAVFQLRADLPRPIGCVYWRTVGRPDFSPLLPWYLGVRDIPEAYCHPVFRRQIEIWNPSEPLAQEIFQPDPSLIWWKFQSLQQAAATAGEQAIQMVRAAWSEMERRLWREQPEWETKLLSAWPTDTEVCFRRIDSYCVAQSEAASKEAERLMDQATALARGLPSP